MTTLDSVARHNPDFSVVISTYNRSGLLRATLRSVLAQESNEVLSFEIIVVDNNSSDDTCEVVRPFTTTGAVSVRYLFEGRQGVAYARNAGIQAAAGTVIAFIDDDVSIPREWLTTLDATMKRHPEIAFVGGKVLPAWEQDPPAWLTRDHWSPLGLLDHGDTPFTVSSRRPYCLVSGNLGVRREVFDQVGVFDPAFQRIKDGIGSTEDHEFEMRVWRAGGLGLYEPKLVAVTDVPASRMTKTYHRRWHKGHGAFSAMMWPYSPQKDAPTLFGLPPFYYRTLLVEAANVARAKLRRNDGEAFLSETALWHASTYVRKLRELHAGDDGRSAWVQLVVFGFRLLRRKLSVPVAGSR